MDLYRRCSLFLLTPLSLFIFLLLLSSLTSTSTILSSSLKSLFFPIQPSVTSTQPAADAKDVRGADVHGKMNGSKVAICLVGGARRFELTGPSIINNLLLEYPDADLFLNSPLDRDAFKFSILRHAPSIATVRIFSPEHIEEKDFHFRVLTSTGSPKGIQGLLQYFNLVEGCLALIEAHETRVNIRYNWIVRTLVDGFWSAPLHPSNFVPGTYLIPSGAHCLGLNDRFGIGDRNTSTVALSRLSLIPRLDSAGKRRLNSEAAFMSQLLTSNVTFQTRKLPFCVLSDRTCPFPPKGYVVPVVSIASHGPLNGVKCWPCTAACVGDCVTVIAKTSKPGGCWTDWRDGSLKLCNARGKWEDGWERIFDEVAGSEAAAVRKRVRWMDLNRCVENMEEMKRKAARWDSPPSEVICRFGLAAAAAAS